MQMIYVLLPDGQPMPVTQDEETLTVYDGVLDGLFQNSIYFFADPKDVLVPNDSFDFSRFLDRDLPQPPVFEGRGDALLTLDYLKDRYSTGDALLDCARYPSDYDRDRYIDEKKFLVCSECGEAFDDISIADNHVKSDKCSLTEYDDVTYTIKSESEAL